jgi:hypothetical protein
MRATRAVILAGLAVAFVVLSIVTYQAKAGSSSIRVISTIHNYVCDSLSGPEPCGTAYHTQGDDYTSATPYVYSGPSSNITDVQWNLLLENSHQFVHLTFSATPNSPDSSKLDGLYDANLNSRCFDAQGNIISFLNILPGTANNLCSLRISFQFAGTTYVFVMSPEPPYGSITGSASVACNTTTGKTCKSWTITPYSGGTNPGVAGLYTLAGTLVGTYYNTYRIDVTPATH